MSQHDTLKNEMDGIEVGEGVLRAMSCLAYTASETGLIPVDFHSDDDLAAMIKLTKLAEKYSAGVPRELQM